MAITANRSILAKADMTSGDLAAGGLLNPDQAKKFIEVLIKESVLMKDAIVEPMNSNRKLLEKISFPTRILRAGNESTALPLADRSKPTVDKETLDAQLFKAEVRLSDQVLRRNIEKEQLQAHVRNLIGGAVSRDMEEVAIQGDTGSADAFLAQLDGLIVQATSNVFAGGSVDLDVDVLREMLKLLPSQFHRRRNAMKFYAGVQIREDYAYNTAARGTPEGDKALMSESALRYRAIPVAGLPMMPETLGAGSDESKVLLMDPKNAHFGIHTQIQMEEDRLVREGVNIIVTSLEFDVKYEVEDAVVKADAIKAL